MDATLAFVTASFARVRPGDLVLDPFCGAPAESFILRATSSVEVPDLASVSMPLGRIEARRLYTIYNARSGNYKHNVR